jgi:predicted nucleotidyltransferase
LSLLSERLLAVHRGLVEAGLPHAFGGAIALAYCTQEPRGTRDIDVNIFIEPDRANEVFDAMPKRVTVTRGDRAAARRDGQVRVMWDETPIDLFFDTHEFHREAAQGVAEVPFDGASIPVLGCEALIVFKAMFNRTRDWADIEDMVDAGVVDGPRVLDSLRSLLGRSDPAVVRIAALIARRA